MGLARQGRPFTRTPQSWWTHEDGVQRVSRIFTFEGMELFWDSLGVEEMRENFTSQGENYQDYYSAASRDYVAKHFAEDIERYKYVF